MGATLAALQILQSAETALAELRNRIAAKWRRVTQQEKRLSRLQSEWETQHRDIQQRQMEVDRLELDLKTREVQIAKLRTALNSAKTNKEYAAVLTQLNTAKVDTGKIEERALELITQLDEFKQQAAQADDVRTTEQKRLEEQRAAAETFEAESRARLNEFTKRREETAAQVPEGALLLFERVADSNDGQALALVIRTNPKREEYACEACNMSVTLQQVNTLMSRDEPVTCHTCGHILYLEGQLTPAR
ncbi:MAG: hypothetical protein V3T70_02985 [Phycisphaerae bacterium]